jgi:Uma2 family endonuclease
MTHFTEHEYLARERVGKTRHEYVNGEIFAMAGAIFRHNTIALSVGAALLRLVRGRSCRVFNSDQRISVTATGMFTYADTGVVCGKARYHDKDAMSLLNPVLLVEVLSHSTEDYDRGEKLAHYRRNPSVQEILIVWQSELRVEHHRRVDSEEWRVREHREGSIEIPALEGAISLDDIYAQVDWNEPEDTPSCTRSTLLLHQ